MRLVMGCADRANKFIDDRQPWNLRKDVSRSDELRDVCTIALNLFRQLAIYLAPVLPQLARQTEELLNTTIGPGDWNQAAQPQIGTRRIISAHAETGRETTGGCHDRRQQRSRARILEAGVQ